MSNSTNQVQVGDGLIPATVGSEVETMLVGKVVKVKVIAENGSDFTVEYLGERTCLDFSEKWYVEKGYRFNTAQININRAAEWQAKGY